MKKLIAVAVAALSLGAFADDSYLYWMTPSSVSWKESGTEDLSYSYVAIGVMDNATGQNVAYLANTTYGTATTSESAQLVGSGSGSWYANLSTYASNAYSFYIELFNDTSSVGRSVDVLSYESAKTYATTFGTQAPSTQAWSTTSFTTAAIPEPTSGLLMLFGLSALALRRKRPLKA